MDKDINPGYKERPHTADLSLDVWAQDVPTLFTEAAKGMYALMGGRIATSPREIRHLVLSDPDKESLLVSFLSELIYLNEIEQLGFSQFEISIENQTLEGILVGGYWSDQVKSIKAVTYHNLVITNNNGIFEVTIVFDV